MELDDFLLSKLTQAWKGKKQCHQSSVEVINVNSEGEESSRVVTRDQEGQRESGYQELK